MRQRRRSPAAAALNSRLCAIGGYPTQAGIALASVEAIAPGRDRTWSLMADLPDGGGRGSGAATATRDRIYRTEGDDGSDAADSLDSLAVYDPRSNRWQYRAIIVNAAPRRLHHDICRRVANALEAASGPALAGDDLWGSKTRPPVLTWPSMRPARIR
jgi:hypothetical protein